MNRWPLLIILLVVGGCQPQRTSSLVEMPVPADATTVAADVANAEDQPEFPPQQPISERISGRVVRVTDGDTLVVLVDVPEQIRIRLEGIDAPEIGQPWGTQAPQALSDLVFEQTVDVWIIGEDRYDRKLGRVYVGDRAVDVNVALVEKGLAWHYKRYSDDEKLAEAEAAARQERRGLWAAPRPIASWAKSGAGECRAQGVKFGA